MTEDQMVGWYHQLNGHKFEQAPEDGEGEGSLACCSPWGHKEVDMTDWTTKNSQNVKCKINTEEFLAFLFTNNEKPERDIKETDSPLQQKE